MGHMIADPTGRLGTWPQDDPAWREALWRDQATIGITIALRCSRHALEGLIGLGDLLTYLEADGPPALVAGRMLREVDRSRIALTQLAHAIDYLGELAQRGQEQEPG